MGKYNTWHVDAYFGWNDYDGPQDCNFHEDIIFDKRFTKGDVVSMIECLYSHYRVVVVSKVTLVENEENE